MLKILENIKKMEGNKNKATKKANTKKESLLVFVTTMGKK